MGEKKMSSTNPTSYVKSPFLKSVIDEEGTSCEEKIEKIKGLVEGKKLSLLKSGQSVSGSSQTNNNNAPNGNAPLNSNNNGNVPLAPSNESDAVLSGLSGNKERQLGETRCVAAFHLPIARTVEFPALSSHGQHRRWRTPKQQKRCPSSTGKDKGLGLVGCTHPYHSS